MKLGTRGRYAVMAMVDLARHTQHQLPVSLGEIAERQGLPIFYLEQLFVLLRRRDFVKSVRGQNGGYILARTAAQITIADVIKAVDETVKATRCQENTETGCLPDQSKCMTHHLWETLEDCLTDYLSAVSLEDVCHQRFPQLIFLKKEAHDLPRL